MGRLVQHDAVDRLVRRIEHADRQAVRLPGLIGVGHVEHERRLAAFVPADRRAVEPDLGR